MATIRAIAIWFNARRRIIALVLFGWVILVVVGAGTTPDSDNWIGVPDLGNLVLVVVGVFALIGLAMVIYLRPNRQSGGIARRTALPIRTLVFMTIAFVLLVLLFGPRLSAEDEPPAEPVPELTAQQEAATVVDDPRLGTKASDIAALLLIFIIAAAVLVRSRRRFAPGIVSELEGGLEADLATAIDEATQHLHLGTDPRTAVLAAYASLERALTERGQHREPAETPTEHMARVLAAVPALAAPAVRLGRLYELARFSDHPITAEDRDRAADALSRARRTLVSLAGDAP